MPKLGTDLPFTADGSVDSETFVPQQPHLRLALKGTPTEDGDLRVWMFDTELGVSSAEEIGSADLSGLADRANIIPIEGAFYGLRVGFFMRYTNTTTTAGTISFAGAEG